MRRPKVGMLARRLLGENCELRVLDSEVQLSRLLGAHHSYIDANIPHVGLPLRRNLLISVLSS